MEVFVAKKLVDKVYFFIAPKIVGGKEAKTPVAGIGILNLQEALALKDIQIEKLEEDILIIGRVDKDKVWYSVYRYRRRNRCCKGYSKRHSFYKVIY